MKVINEDFINLKELKRTLNEMEKERPNANFWSKINNGVYVVAEAMNNVIPQSSKIGLAATGLLGLASQAVTNPNFQEVFKNQHINELLSNVSMSFAMTAIGSYAVMKLATSVAEGFEKTTQNKIFNLEVLHDKAKKLATEIDISLSIKPDNDESNKKSKALLKSLTKNLFNSENEKTNYQNDFLFDKKTKKSTLKM